MKKLALIVLLAVVASRVLSEHRDRDHHHAAADRPFSIVSAIFDDEPPAPPQPGLLPAPPLLNAPHPPAPPHQIRTFTWRGGDVAATDEPAPPKRAPRAKRPPAKKGAPVEAAVTAPKEAPAWFPKSEWEDEQAARPDATGARVLLGRLSVSDDRAQSDLRKTINREVADWLAADIPLDWTPPVKLVDRMIQGTYVQTVIRSFGPKESAADKATQSPTAPELDELYTLYRAGQKLDFSDARRADFLKHYRRDVASARMKRSGSIVAVVLASLALISFYIRTDEATKGYYTNRLRVLALAGLGVAGAVAYRYWA